MKTSKKDEELITKSVIIFIIFGFIASFLIYSLKEPEGFTQLYFENYENLPYSVDVNKDYPISFTVVSFENEPTDYKIIATDGKRWDFTLKPNENKTVSFYFTPKKEKLPANYTISMINKNQSIYFWYGTTKVKLFGTDKKEFITNLTYSIPLEIVNDEFENITYKITSNQTNTNLTLSPGESRTIILNITAQKLVKMDSYKINIEGNLNQTILFKYKVKD